MLLELYIALAVFCLATFLLTIMNKGGYITAVVSCITSFVLASSSGDLEIVKAYYTDASGWVTNVIHYPNAYPLTYFWAMIGIIALVTLFYNVLTVISARKREEEWGFRL